MRGVAVAVAVGPVLMLAQSFEVATIKPAPMRSLAEMRSGTAVTGLHVAGSRVQVGPCSLQRLIYIAYDLRSHQLAAPDGINQPSWDIEAKTPEGTSRKQVLAMLQALLAERFKLKVHSETREMPVWALIVGPDGPWLSASDPNSPPPRVIAPAGGFTMDVTHNERHVQSVRSGDKEVVYISGADGNYTITTINDRTRIRGSNVTADRLAQILSPMLFDRHVLNLTGLTGQYEIAIDLPPLVQTNGDRIEVLPNGQKRHHHEALRPQEIRTSLEKLGLRLDARRAPVEVLVVDHAEKEPTAN